MKAVYYDGEGKFELREAYEAEPKVNEVTLRLAYCGICGSDVHIANAEWDWRIATFPRIIGHETSGEIIKVGSEVKDWKVGDRVVVRPLDTCGECQACKNGDTNVCPSVKYLGIEKDGAFQNTWTVDASVLHKCPDDLSLKHAALVEPLAVCCHAANRSGVKAGGTAVVIGGGPIGLMTAAVLKSKGVRVVVSELSPVRLENCRKMGIKCVNPTETDLKAYIDGMTDNYGVDAVIEASGSQAGLSSAASLCHPNARIVTVATYAKPMQLAINQLHFKQVCLVTTRAYRAEDFDEALDLMNRRAFDCDLLISRVMPLEELQQALELCKTGTDIVKVLIDCQSVQ